MKFTVDDYNVHNLIEDVVDLAIEELLSEDNSACDCPLCRLDTKSIILNKLTPQYYPVISTGVERSVPTLKSLETPLFNQIMLESFRAIRKVKESPRHDSNRRILHNSAQDAILYSLNEIVQQEKLNLNNDQLSTLMTYVLNNIEPSYTTTAKGDAFSRTDQIDPAYLAKLYACIYNGLKDIKAL